MSRRRLVLGLAALAAGTGLVAGCERGDAGGKAFNGVDLTGAGYGREFSLPDTDGRMRTLADFAGRVTVYFFGYTQCPDVCPTTMAELSQIKRSLGADGARLQAVFITVDPERDTPELLKQYVAGFDPEFVALRGTAEQTAAAAKSFKVFFARVPGKEEGAGYTVDHTAGAYVVDTKGRLRLFERYGTPVEAMAADIRRLLDEA